MRFWKQLKYNYNCLTNDRLRRKIYPIWKHSKKKSKKFDMDAFYNIKNEVAELENRKIIRPRHLTEKLPIVKAHLSIRANNLLVSLNKSPMNMTEVAQQTALQKPTPQNT